MISRMLRRLLPCLCAVLMLGCAAGPALAAPEETGVYINGRALDSDAAPFVDNGTAYVPLAAFAKSMGRCTVTWDGTAAHVSAQGLELTAVPGELWVEANGRCLYVPGGVRLVAGRTMVPVRTLGTVYGLEVGWNGALRRVSVSGKSRALASGDAYYDREDLYWLSRIISAESRGEPLLGQIAVGNVVLNRVRSSQYPGTIREVVFDDKYGVQFEPVSNGTVYLEPTESSVRAAKLCLEGAGVVADCMYFFAPALSQGTWIVNNCTYYTTIGCHRFYR